MSPRPLPTNMRQHRLWSTRLELPALCISSRRSPTAPVSFSARGSSTATSIFRILPLPAGCRVCRGFFPSVGQFACFWSGFWVFLRVFYGGESIWCCAVYGCLVLLYYIPSVGSSVIYPALVCARYMLALPSATPGMPYAVHVRALGISTSGHSQSWVKPTVCGVCMQVALTEHVPAPPTPSTAPPCRPRDPRSPACARDLQSPGGTTLYGAAAGSGDNDGYEKRRSAIAKTWQET
jgi:hypothetical protein